MSKSFTIVVGKNISEKKVRWIESFLYNWQQTIRWNFKWKKEIKMLEQVDSKEICQLRFSPKVEVQNSLFV